MLHMDLSRCEEALLKASYVSNGVVALETILCSEEELNVLITAIFSRYDPDTLFAMCVPIHDHSDDTTPHPVIQLVLYRHEYVRAMMEFIYESDVEIPEHVQDIIFGLMSGHGQALIEDRFRDKYPYIIEEYNTLDELAQEGFFEDDDDDLEE